MANDALIKLNENNYPRLYLFSHADPPVVVSFFFSILKRAHIFFLFLQLDEFEMVFFVLFCWEDVG